MGLPAATILKAVTALGSALGVYMARAKEDKGAFKAEDSGRALADLQADFQKQGVFLSSVIKEVEALTLQVQKQQATQFWLKVALSIQALVSFLLLILSFWLISRTQ